MRYTASILVSLAVSSLLAGCVLANEFSLYDIAKHRVLSLIEFAQELKDDQIVIVGESHDNRSHHQGQLEIIKALHQQGEDLAVGLEMMQYVDQARLDRWVQGGISEKEFETIFVENWGFTWSLYRDIFLYCRDNNIPMVGLNVPRAITRQVATKGFASLTGEQLSQLPPITCDVTGEYRSFLKSTLGVHGHGSGSFENFCEAQLVWDTAMAVYSLEYLKQHTQRKMVLLCGYIHAWKPAILRQMKKQDQDVRVKVVLPQIIGRISQKSLSSDDTDYLLLGVK